MATTRLAVIGWPVDHSRSPAMHNAALAAVGLDDWEFQLLPVPAEEFGACVHGMRDSDYRGASVTIPHKERAVTLVDRLSDRAQAIGAVNTLIFEPGGELVGDNTDAPGFIASLPAIPAPGSTAIVLGAGGVAHAVVWALRDCGVEVKIWNRTASRAERLAERFGATAVGSVEPAEMLVNCTAAGLEGDPFASLPLLPEQLGDYRIVADAVYHGGPGRLLEAAAAAGAETADGIEMLVQQGAIAFEQWTGLDAPVDVMRAAALAG
jgi:shikimate dehydrogenase